MKESEIKKERIQNLLLEVLSEALASLNNPAINSLSITQVRCSKGKYDAQVYIESSDMNDEEKREVLRELKKAHSMLKEYVLVATGWYKSPNFSFVLDDSLKDSKRLDEIFDKIKKDNGNL